MTTEWTMIDPDYEKYDEPITKRYMIQYLLETVQDEGAIDAALRALLPRDLSDAKYRSELIELVRVASADRLRANGKCSETVHLTWKDVDQIFADIQAVVGVPYKKQKPRRPRTNPPQGNGSVIPLKTKDD